jgi:pimeloyl-ACP methyl ester carboxylesterase
MSDVEHHLADVNGVRLHYAATGRGRLMMFVHGFPEFWYAWRRQLAEFGRDHQAVAPDMRGYNLSSKPEGLEPYALGHLIEDLRALAEHLGHRRFTLCAHDWGGAVAWAFAIRHPDWLDRLIIVNAPHPAVFQRELTMNPAQQQASQYMLVFRTEGAEALLAADRFAALNSRILSPLVTAGHLTEADRQAYLEAWSQPGALTGGLNYYRAARVGPPSAEGAPARGIKDDGPAEHGFVVRVPTLVIWGMRDVALLPGNLDGLEEYVPDLTVKRIEDGSHWVIHEHPDVVNRHIRDFLARGAR